MLKLLVVKHLRFIWSTNGTSKLPLGFPRSLIIDDEEDGQHSHFLLPTKTSKITASTLSPPSPSHHQALKRPFTNHQSPLQPLPISLPSRLHQGDYTDLWTLNAHIVFFLLRGIFLLGGTEKITLLEVFLVCLPLLLLPFV